MKSLNQIWQQIVWQFQEIGMLQGLGATQPSPILLNKWVGSSLAFSVGQAQFSANVGLGLGSGLYV